MEQLEQEEAAAGSMIAVKRKKGKGKTTGRQTKLTSTGGVSTNSFNITRPSAFAEEIEPTIPEFNAQPKKASGGRGRGKAIKMEEESKEGIELSKSPEKKAAAKAVKDAFCLSDDETPPPSLFERLKEKGKQQSVLKFQKKTGPSDDDDEVIMEVETPPKKTAGKRQKDANQKKPGVKAGKKRSQKTLEAFMDSEDSDSDVPIPKKAKKTISKPKPGPAAKSAGKSAKVSLLAYERFYSAGGVHVGQIYVHKMVKES